VNLLNKCTKYCLHFHSVHFYKFIIYLFRVSVNSPFISFVISFVHLHFFVKLFILIFCARPNHQARAKEAGVLKIWMEPEPLVPTWDTLETYRRLRQLAEQSGERSRSRTRSPPRRRRSFSRSQSRDSAAGAGGGFASNVDWKAAQLRNWRDQQVRSEGTNMLFAVLGIRDIFVRIRIRGSVPLTNGSGSGPGSGSNSRSDSFLH
jgi:hypothetical protein